MDLTTDKSARPVMWTLAAASLILVLCLCPGLAFRLTASVDDFHVANSDRHFAKSHQRESAVASQEKQSRLRSKAPRRHLLFGALPLDCAPDIPSGRCERSPAVAKYKTLPTHSHPNDRAPPRAEVFLIIIL